MLTKNQSDLKSQITDKLFPKNKDDLQALLKQLVADLLKQGIHIHDITMVVGVTYKVNELTPTEVGHLCRYLDLNVPKAKPAIDRILRELDINR